MRRGHRARVCNTRNENSNEERFNGNWHSEPLRVPIVKYYPALLHLNAKERRGVWLEAQEVAGREGLCSRTTLPTGLKIAAPAPQPAVEAAPNLPHFGIDFM